MLKRFDIFGTYPRFYFEGKGIYQTYMGSIFSFLLLFISVAAFVFYGKELIQKSNPQTIFTEEYVENPEPYIFKKSEKSIALGLQNFDLESIHFIDESYYHLQLQLAVHTNVKNITSGEIYTDVQKQEIPVRKCQKDDFIVPETESYFHGLSFMENLYCIDDYEKNGDIKILGDFGQDKFQRLEFRFKQCQNSTDYNKCKPQEEIDAMLKPSYMAIYYTDQIVQPKNFTNPFKYIGRDSFFTSSNIQKKQVNFYFRNVYVESNDGLIWDNFQTQQSLMFSYQYEQVFTQPDDDGTFFYLQMRLEKIKESKYYRTYLNMATVLAQVGGILKIVFMFFWFLSYMYSTRNFNMHLLNQIFTFKYNNQANYQKQKSVGENDQKLKNSQFLQYIKSNSLLKFNTVKSFFSLKFLSQQEKEQKKLFNIAHDKLKKELDFVKLLEKMHQIDKLKQLLLDEDQISLFESHQKTVISIEDNDNKQVQKENLKEDNISQQKEKQEQYKKQFEAYMRIRSKSQLNATDQKLLELMDQNLIQVFKKMQQNENQLKNYCTIKSTISQIDNNNNFQNMSNDKMSYKNMNFSLQNNQNQTLDTLTFNQQAQNDSLSKIQFSTKNRVKLQSGVTYYNQSNSELQQNEYFLNNQHEQQHNHNNHNFNNHNNNNDFDNMVSLKKVLSKNSNNFSNNELKTEMFKLQIQKPNQNNNNINKQKLKKYTNYLEHNSPQCNINVKIQESQQDLETINSVDCIQSLQNLQSKPLNKKHDE